MSFCSIFLLEFVFFVTFLSLSENAKTCFKQPPPYSDHLKTQITSILNLANQNSIKSILFPLLIPQGTFNYLLTPKQSKSKQKNLLDRPTENHLSHIEGLHIRTLVRTIGSYFVENNGDSEKLKIERVIFKPYLESSSLMVRQEFERVWNSQIGREFFKF